MKRTTALVATLLALVVVALPSVASAASLNVRGPVVTTVVAERCDDAIEVRPDTTGGVAGSGRTTTFEVLGIAEACTGQLLTVVVFSATGTLLGEGSGAGLAVTGTTAKVTLTPVDPRGVPLSDVAGAAATLGTWGVDAQWVYTPPSSPVSTCVVRYVSNDKIAPHLACAVGTPTVRSWGESTAANVQVEFPVNVTGDVGNSTYVDFLLVAPDQGLPSGWSWSNADILRVNFHGGGSGVTSACRDLPVIDGRSPKNYGGRQNLEFHLVQGGSRGICQRG